MEINHEERPWKFADDQETRNINLLPGEFSFGGNEEDDSDDDHLTPARTSFASYPAAPMSPGTPWIRSPMHPAASPGPPLIYDCLASLHRSEGNIFSVAITKDLLFTASSSRRIYAWRQPDCTEVGFITTTRGEIRAMLASENLLFTAHGDCRIRAWELMSPTESFRPRKMMTLPRRRSMFFLYGKKKRNNHMHTDSITCLAYNNRESLLFSGSFDQTVRVWKISEKKCVDSFVAHEGRVNAIVINQEDRCVFTCSTDGTVKIWRRVLRESSHILMMILKYQASPVNTMALSLSAGVCHLYTGSSDGMINFWVKEKASGRYNRGGSLQGHHFAVLCLEIVEDFILSGSEDATIRIWKREKGNSSSHSSVAVIDGHHGPVKCLAAAMEERESGKGLLVYSASIDQTLKVWKVKVCNVDEYDHDAESESTESEIMGMGPVLSPLWVQRNFPNLE
ncbi:hypothetical protein ACS0TY_035155 [Phlomoides rotata]